MYRVKVAIVRLLCYFTIAVTILAVITFLFFCVADILSGRLSNVPFKIILCMVFLLPLVIVKKGLSYAASMETDPFNKMKKISAKKAQKQYCQSQGIAYEPKRKAELKPTLEDNYDRIVYNAELVRGLPLGGGTDCKLAYGYDSLVVEGAGCTFSLAYKKIVDLKVKTDKKTESQYVSSAGGAVAGAMLFGVIGAMIGGRVKRHNYVQGNTFFIVTYKNDEKELKVIVFKILNERSMWNIIQWNSEVKNNLNADNEVIKL